MDGLSTKEAFDSIKDRHEHLVKYVHTHVHIRAKNRKKRKKYYIISFVLNLEINAATML